MLEPTYDINNVTGSLILNGKMYLHQNDKFRQVFINGNLLPVGTYTFAQLTNLYAANFPATWTPQTGATNFSTGSGSLTVLGQAAPAIVIQPVAQSLVTGQRAQLTVVATGNQPLTYQWRVRTTGSSAFVNLTDGGGISGSTTTNLTIANLTLANAGDYVVVISNAFGSLTSALYNCA